MLIFCALTRVWIWNCYFVARAFPASCTGNLTSSLLQYFATHQLKIKPCILFQTQLKSSKISSKSIVCALQCVWRFVWRSGAIIGSAWDLFRAIFINSRLCPGPIFLYNCPCGQIHLATLAQIHLTIWTFFRPSRVCLCLIFCIQICPSQGLICVHMLSIGRQVIKQK